MGNAFDVGDEVLTAGGIVGYVIDIDGDRVTLETSVGASFVVLRQYVLRKIEPPVDTEDEDGSYDEAEYEDADHDEHDGADAEHDEHDEDDDDGQHDGHDGPTATTRTTPVPRTTSSSIPLPRTGAPPRNRREARNHPSRRRRR